MADSSGQRWSTFVVGNAKWNNEMPYTLMMRVAKIQKADSIKCWQSNQNAHSMLVRMQCSAVF